MATGAETQFPEPEEVLRQALQDYAVITLDVDGKILQWSEGAEKVFGWQESEVAGRSFDLLFSPEDQAASKPAEELGRAVRGEASPDERWHIHKMGRRIFVAGIVRAIRNESGEITGFSKVAREITAQRLQQLQQEADLYREQARRVEAEKRWKYLEEIFENVPAIVALIRLPEKTIVFANLGLRQLVRGRDLIGRNIREAYPAIDQEFFHLFDAVAATGERYTAKERPVQLPGGRGLEERYFDFACQPMRSETGDFEAILIFGVDVTDRVEARWELQSESERLKREIEQRRDTESIAEERAAVVEEQAELLDLAQDGVFSMNAAGTIEFWNSGAERMYGWSREEAIGRNVHELLRTEASVPLDEIKEIVFTQGEWEGDLKHFSRADKELVVSTRWVVRKRRGAPAGWLEIARDITGRKQMEERLRQTDKLESLGVLAGGIAHDFNNILTGVLGNISLAMDLDEPDSPAQDLLRNALQASERAAMLTRQILAYAGKGEFVLQNINISAVVQKTMKLIGGSIPENVHVDLALEEGLPPVRADETQIEQVAMNLILNAAEAIGEGGGKVAIRTGIEDVDRTAEVKPYDVGQPAPGRYIILEVMDTGEGIDPGIKPYIFDPFFTTKFTGRGLGLAALSGIVRNLKGAVLVDSTPGQGSVFRVLLPASRAIPEAGELTNEQLDPILVVDDEETVRRVAELVLRKRGYEVASAANGQEAMNVFRERDGRLALVLLDMTMPGMSGEEVFRRLKRIRSSVPVILSSGFTEEEATRRFGGLGVADFLQKPYTSRALLEKIEKALTR
ncbi:MAG TPA: PAS domain S-box protein [Bryobacteraceae bacterium]